MTALPALGFDPPPPVASSPPDPAMTERMARHSLAAHLGFSRVGVRAPSWDEILFRAGKIPFRLPRFPDGATLKVDQKPTDPPVGDAEKMARSLMKDLSKDKPRGSSPRSFSARLSLPPAADAMASWKRRATLTVLGPEVARLLVASGGLTSTDVDILASAYPAGMDGERKAAVEAAMNVTAAASRHKREADLPSWLNDQLLTFMAEARPLDFFAELHKGATLEGDQQDAQQAQGPSASGPPSRLAQANQPPAGEGIT